MNDDYKGLVLLTREEGEKAYVRPEWVEEWVANGWKHPQDKEQETVKRGRKAKDAE